MVVVVERSPAAFEREAVIGALDELPPPVRKLELVVYPVGARPPAYALNYPDGEGECPFWFVLDAAIGRSARGRCAGARGGAARAGDGSRDAFRGEGVAPLGR